ncbi:hypothetical protein ACJOT4_01690 [Nocardiopsis sp. frass4]
MTVPHRRIRSTAGARKHHVAGGLQLELDAEPVGGVEEHLFLPGSSPASYAPGFPRVSTAMPPKSLTVTVSRSPLSVTRAGIPIRPWWLASWTYRSTAQVQPNRSASRAASRSNRARVAWAS